MTLHPLSPLFDPQSIAVFGASDQDDSVGGIVYANLRKGRFPGRLVPINPKHRVVGDVTCYPRIGECGDKVDLAVVATPALAVEQIVVDCAATGVKAMIVLSAGFGEINPAGLAAQQRLHHLARAAGMRLLGPNCVGLLRPPGRMNATFLRGGTPSGGLALVSQSGAICAAISDGAAPNHLGFSAMVSLGNAVDVDVGDIVDFLANDPATEAILLYLEGIRDAALFVSALRQATKQKPVIVLKAGRGAKASKAAATHTGVLLGSDAVFDAALERTGAVRVQTFGQLFAAAELLSQRQRIAGNRLCIVTNGGGAGVLAADRAEDLGIDLPKPSPETLQALNRVLPPYWSHGNPVDILGDAQADRYQHALTACLADPGYDGVLVMLTPQAITDPVAAADAVILAAAHATKPLLACWMGATSVGAARGRLSAAGIPDFIDPERAVEAFSYLAGHERNRQLALELPGPRTGAVADFATARQIITHALSEGREMLTGAESRALLAAARIPVIQALPAVDAVAAVAVANAIGYPVAVKIASPDITHKTEVAGVTLDLADNAAVTQAVARMLERASRLRPDARINGVTVERMAGRELDRELLLGIGHDPVFGPSIVFGAGGTKVEVLKDSAVALPPLTSVLTERLIARTRVAGLLGPFRGGPAVDLAALIDAVLRLSDLACELPQITELDINPLLAGPTGVLAVDVRLCIRNPVAATDSLAHLAIADDATTPKHLRP
ncbi:MAG: acetate--CoA ligase family protein [Pseudorhodobacter sp.]|nr:acetate--CoA ligase family protein [Pseudorhodobacter sp.]